MQYIDAKWDIPEYVNNDALASFRVTGTCMEREGVNHDDLIVVDRSRFPKAPANGKRYLCACYGFSEKRPHLPILMTKVYNGVRDGHHTGITAYTSKPDYDIHITLVLGVICAVLNPDHSLKHQWDISDCPTELPEIDKSSTTNVPVFTLLPAFMNTIEGCRLANVRDDVYAAARIAFKALPFEKQREMEYSLPKHDHKAWYDRLAFWGDILKSVMTGEQFSLAMDALSSWYDRCLGVNTSI